MKKKKKEIQENKVKVFQDEHDLLFSKLVNFDKLILEKTSEPERLIEEFGKFQESLTDHFRNEERQIFPEVLVNSDNRLLVETILLLQREHGYFERDMELLFQTMKFSVYKLKNFFDSELSFKIYSFQEKLRSHALMELSIVFKAYEKIVSQ